MTIYVLIPNTAAYSEIYLNCYTNPNIGLEITKQQNIEIKEGI
jgi:hypothetical protein